MASDILPSEENLGAVDTIMLEVARLRAAVDLIQSQLTVNEGVTSMVDRLWFLTNSMEPCLDRLSACADAVHALNKARAT